MPGYNKIYTAKEMMGAKPKVAPGAMRNLLLPQLRAHAPADLTADQFVTSFMEDKVDSRVHEMTEKVIGKLCENPDLMKDISSIAGARTHDYGDFFVGQLNYVIPLLLMAPIRGISFMTMPMVMWNSAGKQVTYQAYNWNSQSLQVIDSSTTNTPQVRVTPVKGSDNILDFDNAVGITWNEARAVAETMAKPMGDVAYDPFVGNIAPIAANFIALKLGYLLELDNIAYNGSLNTLAPNNGPFQTLVNNDGTDSLNNVPFINSVSILGSSAPVYWNGDGTNGLSVSQKYKIMAGVVNNVSKVSATTSKGNFAANVLRVDLNTYLDAGISTNEYKDTSPLALLIENGIVDAIIPVAAWNEIYPNQVTMVAEFCDPQIYFYNVALPLTQTGVELQGSATKFNYRYRNSGLSILNTLGLTQFQMLF